MTTFASTLGSAVKMPRLSLVQRLRVVFILIVAVIGVAVTLALWQFKTLNEAQSQLLRVSVPIMVRAQVVERALHDIIITVSQIENASDPVALTRIENDVSQQFQRAKRSIEGLPWTQEHVRDVELILQRMGEMETGVQKSLLIKRQLFETEDDLDAQRKQMTRRMDEIRILVEQLSFTAAQDMDATISRLQTSGPLGLDQASVELRDETQRVSLIAQIALELETIANVVGQLGNSISLETLNDTRDFLAFRMRGALQLMVRLPQGQDRTDLAIKVSEFRDLVLGDAGILRKLETYTGWSHDLALEFAAEKIQVRDMTDATELLTASAHNQLRRSGHLTQASTQRLILILALAAISVAIIVALSILVLVERQINQRIGLLTDSVMRIAAGDTDHETRVSGHDELGRMALALETFKRNARELLRSNTELEKFAYAAAHDLRSPLQSINDLATWTIEDDDNHLSDDSRANLDLLQARVVRLSALLADLLQYARVGAEIADPVPVDLEDFMSETLSMVDPSQSFKLTHTCQDRAIETYLHPLQKVLLNLMSNTVKHHDKGHGEIQVHSWLKDGRLHVSYSDDGPGIPPEYHKKVFELFQTLKPRDEIEGSGLGLAITEKLVEHFDGSIALREAPEVPSETVFEFDFPATPQRDIAVAA